MFENIVNFFKKLVKTKPEETSKEMAKERLHLVLMQDRANVSADFLDMMKQEIIEVIKKYIDVDENAIYVRLTNKNEDGTNGAPTLYANIPIISIKEEQKKKDVDTQKEEVKLEEKIEKKQTEEKKEESVKGEVEIQKPEVKEKECKKEVMKQEKPKQVEEDKGKIGIEIKEEQEEKETEKGKQTTKE